MLVDDLTTLEQTVLPGKEVWDAPVFVLKTCVCTTTKQHAVYACICVCMCMCVRKHVCIVCMCVCARACVLIGVRAKEEEAYYLDLVD